jgi:hypothetical protein
VPQPAAPIGTPPQARPIRPAGAHRISRREQLHFLRRAGRRMISKDAVYTAHNLLITAQSSVLIPKFCSRIPGRSPCPPRFRSSRALDRNSPWSVALAKDCRLRQTSPPAGHERGASRHASMSDRSNTCDTSAGHVRLRSGNNRHPSRDGGLIVFC